MENFNRNRFVDYKYNEPNCIIFWLNGREIGRLLLEKDGARFEGDANISAKIFFNQHVKPLIDEYLRKKLEMFN